MLLYKVDSEGKSISKISQNKLGHSLPFAHIGRLHCNLSVTIAGWAILAMAL